MTGNEALLTEPLQRRARIGVGAGEDRSKAIHSKAEAERLGFTNVAIYDDPCRLALDLRDGRLDAAVRGSMDSNKAMAAVRKAFKVDKVLRAAFMEPVGGRMFLLAPVGIDEGWTADEKIELARLGDGLLGRSGRRPLIGVMSGGRSSDRGRMKEVDRTIDVAQEVVRTLTSEGIRAKDVQILLEDASRECDMIIAPDGISGNLIFRSLHFLGGARALGAPILNIDQVYIDTSRAKESYLDSIDLAASLVRP